jgi:acetoin utilization protein AcuC
VDVVPRAWSHLVGEVVHAPVPASADVPVQWLSYVRERLGREGPRRMTDGAQPEPSAWSPRTNDPAGSAVDRAITATREAVLGLHGLDPFGDG